MIIKLTLRQKQCLFLAAKGKTTREIAAILWVTMSTVASHLKDAYRIFNLEGGECQMLAVLYCLKYEVFKLEDVLDPGRDHTFLTGSHGQVIGSKHDTSRRGNING